MLPEHQKRLLALPPETVNLYLRTVPRVWGRVTGTTLPNPVEIRDYHYRPTYSYITVRGCKRSLTAWHTLIVDRGKRAIPRSGFYKALHLSRQTHPKDSVALDAVLTHYSLRDAWRQPWEPQYAINRRVTKAAEAKAS